MRDGQLARLPAESQRFAAAVENAGPGSAGADVNADGEITVGDINAIIKVILGG